MADCYVVLDGSRVVGVSARFQGAELLRSEHATRWAKGFVRPGEPWEHARDAAYSRQRIENHELRDGE